MGASPGVELERRDAALALALLALTALVFGRAGGFELINFDDGGYLGENPHVQAGLSLEGARWAFNTFQEGLWHPLTWLSHMAVVELFGAAPGPSHLANVALHAVNAALAYLLLVSMTGARGPALLCAALFALHPLRVESVAWVSERKDVLCVFFWLCCTGLYLRVRRRGGVGSHVALHLAFALGLLAKPMLVTLPVTLLLFDLWPLGRLEGSPRELLRGLPRALVDKLGLLAMSVAASVVAVRAQAEVGALASAEEVSLSLRLANAAVTPFAYLGQLAWPLELSLFYPLRPIAPGLGVAAAAGLFLVTWALTRELPRRPALLVGWLFYLVTLLPTLGLLQVGGQAMADRYTYVPSLGLGIALAYGLAPLGSRPAVRAAAAAWLCALAALTVWQLGHFADSERVWRRALAVTGENFMAHNNLGVELERQGRPDEAERHYAEAVRLNPTYPPALGNLANAQARRGAYDEALGHYERALSRNPDSAVTHYNLGLTYARLARYPDAIRQYRRALALDPAYAMAHYSLGAVLAGTGQRGEGIAHLERAIALRPGWPEPRAHLQRILASSEP